VNRLLAAAGLALAISLGLTQLAPGAAVSAARIRLAGELDPSFGRAGLVKGTGQTIGGIAVQPDGRIVVAGLGSLARYLPDGSLDASFGQGGSVATGISADAVALQPDGKVVLAGDTPPVRDSIDTALAVARYKPDGSPDTGFGTNGVTKTVIPETFQCGGLSGANARAVSILAGGDILAAGTVEIIDCYFPENSAWVMVRYKSDGSLDPTFGDAGIVQTSLFGQDDLSGIAVQPDGKVLATGTGEIWGHGGIDIATLALARYESDGSLDPGFGDGGKVTTDPKLYYFGGPTALQGRKILVAGSTSTNGRATWFPVVARYDASGSLDSTFGQNGFAEIRRDLGGPTAMLAQSDGKILISEASTRQGPSRLVRLLPDGRLDRSFGRGGIVSLGGAVSSLALQTDTKILAGRIDGQGWALARLIGGDNCVVPRVGGKTVADATVALTKSHCRRGRISKRFSAAVPRGRVISAAAPRGARRPDGATVALAVSKGRRP
jgi:uncharacterized delta-60 repeat protein